MQFSRQHRNFDAAFFFKRGRVMGQNKAFTLLEIIVVLFIVGVMAAFAIPNLVVSMEQTRAGAAKNNLLSISAGERKYFEDNNAYCTSTTPVVNCGNNLVNLNTNLRLGLSTNDPFNYSCDTTASPFNCTATDTKVTLTTSGANVTCTVGGNYCPT